MGDNTGVKRRLIQLYGPECFIEKLHLRPDGNRTYISKGQRKRMKELSYHHIVEVENGGKATVENRSFIIC